MSGPILVTGAATPLGEAVLAVLGDSGVAASDSNGAAYDGPGDAVVVAPDGTVDPASLVGFAGIVNCAGRVAGTAAQLTRANVEYPARLAAAAKRAGIPRFVQEGSLSVFGPVELIASDSPVAPLTDYGHSRANAETALAALDGDGFATTVLRLPFLFSATHPGMLGTLITAMVRLRLLPTRVGAPAARSMMTYADAAELMVAFVVGERAPVRTASAADPVPLALTVLAAMIGECTGRRIATLSVPAALVAIGRPLAPGLVNALFRSSILTDEVNLLAAGSRHPVRASLDVCLARLAV